MDHGSEIQMQVVENCIWSNLVVKMLARVIIKLYKNEIFFKNQETKISFSI